jgi:hypothetical protein
LYLLILIPEYSELILEFIGIELCLIGLIEGIEFSDLIVEYLCSDPELVVSFLIEEYSPLSIIGNYGCIDLFIEG